MSMKTDPDLLIQDSNDVELKDRGMLLGHNWLYSGPGATLRITRNGVIKQWKYYSTKEGYTTFVVLRPKDGNFTQDL